MSTKPNLSIETSVGMLELRPEDTLRLHTSENGGREIIVKRPLDFASRASLTALAMFFDERSVARFALAEEARANEDPGYAEAETVARTWENAANVAWEMLGGRPDGQFADREHKVRIGARELGKLIDLALRAPNTATKARTEQSTVALAFDDRLVNELAHVARAAWEPKSATWTTVTMAILSELAAMPVEMPTADEMVNAYWADQGTERPRGFECIADLMRQRLAPILAAKDMKIAELTQYVTDGMEVRDGLRARIAELESRTPANECSDAERTQYDATIEQQKARIAELEASTKKAWSERDYFQARASEDPAKMNVIRLEAERDAGNELRSQVMRALAGHAVTLPLAQNIADLRTRAIELEKRLAEQTPVDATGKTPGIVAFDEAERRRQPDASLREKHTDAHEQERDDWEAIAAAVLRTFGAAEVLRSIRMRPPIFLGISFERELPNGDRERVDPSTIRLVYMDETIERPCVPVVVEGEP